MPRDQVQITPSTMVQITLTKAGKSWADDIYNKFGFKSRLEWDEHDRCELTHEHLMHLFGGAVVQNGYSTERYYTQLVIYDQSWPPAH
jgi:hypothetical protein